MIFVINGYDFYTKSGFRSCFGLEIEDQRGGVFSYEAGSHTMIYDPSLQDHVKRWKRDLHHLPSTLFLTANTR